MKASDFEPQKCSLPSEGVPELESLLEVVRIQILLEFYQIGIQRGGG